MSTINLTTHNGVFKFFFSCLIKKLKIKKLKVRLIADYHALVESTNSINSGV